jgi:hypothetical protein
MRPHTRRPPKRSIFAAVYDDGTNLILDKPFPLSLVTDLKAAITAATPPGRERVGRYNGDTQTWWIDTAAWPVVREYLLACGVRVHG